MSFYKQKSVNNLLLFSLFLITGCISNSSKLNSFFERLEESIKNELILEKIKFTSKDSLSFMLPVFETESKQLIQELHYEKEINNLMNSNLDKSSSSSSRGEILLFAFQKHLNRQVINLREIQTEIQEVRKTIKEKMVKDEALYKKEVISIINLNNSKWNIGDTLGIILEIGNDNGEHSIYYKSYPASLDYSDAEDTLKLEGVLIDKFNSQNSLNNNFQKPESLTDLYFKLKILELNRANVFHGANKLKLGGDFNLNLEAYGRPIE